MIIVGYIDCVAISSALMAISLMITIVIKSYNKEEEKGLYVTKLIVTIPLNGLFIWVIANVIKGGN